MPVVSPNAIARFASTRPGYMKITITNFTMRDFEPNYINGIVLCVKRASTDELLADWVSPNKDGYLNIKPTRPMQRGLNFEFEVGPDVVNPIAYDNSGDYILRLLFPDNSAANFRVSMQGAIRPSSDYTPQANRRAAYKAQEPTGGYAQAGATGAGAAGAAAGAAGAGAAGAGAAGAGASGSAMGAAPSVGAGSGPVGAGASAAAAGAAPAAGAAAAGATTQRSGIGITKLIGVFCILILLGIGAFFLKDLLFGGGADVSVPAQEEQTQEEPKPEEEQTPAEESESEESAAPVAQNASCRIDGAKGDDKTIISNCFATNPNQTDLQALLAESMRLNRCEITMRILRTKGRSAEGGGVFAYVYAQYADPNSQYQSPCIQKSQADADYWKQRVSNDRGFVQAEADALMQMLPQSSTGAAGTAGTGNAGSAGTGTSTAPHVTTGAMTGR